MVFVEPVKLIPTYLSRLLPPDIPDQLVGRIPVEFIALHGAALSAVAVLDQAQHLGVVQKAVLVEVELVEAPVDLLFHLRLLIVLRCPSKLNLLFCIFLDLLRSVLF